MSNFSLRRRAFTLVELLVAIAILGALGVLAVPAASAVMRDLSDRSARASLVAFLRTVRLEASEEGVETAVVFATHTLMETDEHDAERRTVARSVRAQGRVSRLVDGVPWDEFADGGPLRLDTAPDVVPLAGPGTPWDVLTRYARVTGRIDLPRHYLVDDGKVSFRPTTGRPATMVGTVRLQARRPDGTLSAVGAPIGTSDLEGRE